MKRFLFSLVLLFMGFYSIAQIHEPVKWRVALQQAEPDNKNQVTINFKATIEEGWHELVAGCGVVNDSLTG